MIWDRLWEKRLSGRPLFFPLIDQDRTPPAECTRRAAVLEKTGADAILIGSSFTLENRLDEAVIALKKETSLPVILFPGSAHQISRHADAILFLSLLSGRNPQYLVEEQIRSAPIVKSFGLEVIPTAYLLVGSGEKRSVHYVSGTEPIPAKRPEIVMAHALAARFMGMGVVYLEAGSGASAPVPPAVIRSVREYADIPLIVGGGIRTPEQAREAREAGADIVVVGHVLEGNFSSNLANDFSRAVHGESVSHPA